MIHADIEVHTETIPPYNHKVRSYKWIGDPAGKVYISWSYELQIDKLPWKLKLVEQDMFGGWYVRADQPLSYWSGKIRLGLIHFLTKTKARIILTCIVWGFGVYHPGTVLRWRDIFERRK